MIVGHIEDNQCPDATHALGAIQLVILECNVPHLDSTVGLADD